MSRRRFRRDDRIEAVGYSGSWETARFGNYGGRGDVWIVFENAHRPARVPLSKIRKAETCTA
ncbi:MAG: hypothetical protein WC959_07575 [Kiritimatiellales bacterium]